MPDLHQREGVYEMVSLADHPQRGAAPTTYYATSANRQLSEAWRVLDTHVVVCVMSASWQDRDGGNTTLLSTYLRTSIRYVFADQGFAGRLVDWAAVTLRRRWTHPQAGRATQLRRASETLGRGAASHG
jgi:hypothetical protein